MSLESIMPVPYPWTGTGNPSPFFALKGTRLQKSCEQKLKSEVLRQLRYLIDMLQRVHQPCYASSEVIACS